MRSCADSVYLVGDKVYYKRQSDRCWRGSATVLGKDAQRVLLKHGGYYIRVHPCRVAHTTQIGKSANRQQQINNQTTMSKKREVTK